MLPVNRPIMNTSPLEETDLPEIRFYHRISLREKSVFYEHLSNLIDGGVTLVSALASFVEKTDNPKMYRLICELLLFIESGDPVSVAMRKFPKFFSKSEVSIVEAGEQSGTLQKSFTSLAKDLRDMEDVKSKVKGALAYPAIILLFLIGAIVLVMTYVVPKLIPLFESTGTGLPFITQTLVYSSSFMRAHLIFIVVTIVLAIFLGRSYVETEKGKRTFHRFLFGVPAFGSLYRNYLIVRFATTFSLLLGAGIPIVKTLRLTGESTGNVIFEDAIAIAVERVAQGEKLADSLEKANETYPVFPKDVTQLISAGERTSTVNVVSGKIAAQYLREVDASISMLVKFVEPLAILIAGVFVLWFAFAIFAAVMKITESVGGM